MLSAYDRWKTQTPEQANGTDGRKYNFEVFADFSVDVIAETEDDAIEEALPLLLKMLQSAGGVNRSYLKIERNEIEPDDFTGNDD